MLNAPGEGGNTVVATAYRWDDRGDLAPREGLQAEVRGAQAEGRGLPRDCDLQPFALLRRLPHTASVFAPGVMVLSGDDRHLLAVMPGGARVNLNAPGLLIISNARTGEVVRDISAPPTDEAVLPEGEAFLVGWARFDARRWWNAAVQGCRLPRACGHSRVCARSQIVRGRASIAWRPPRAASGGRPGPR